MGGKHLLDVLPMVVIAAVCSLMLVTVAQGFWGKYEPAASSSSQTPQDAGFANDAAYAGWYNDASGYEKAVAEHEKTGKPLLLYFYAPWCGYCANFHAQTLSHPKAIAALKGYVKVRVYPGPDSEDNQQLMAAFGANGFPTLFLKRAGDSTYRQVNIYGRGGNLLTPSQFLARLKSLPDSK